MKFKFIALSALALFVAHHAVAQQEIYPQHFNLEEVTLLDSPLKSAMQKNIQHLLEYDVDRLLTPYVRQAGLSATSDTKSAYYRWENLHPNHDNWGSGNFRLDGHVGGHYMTALALAYAACHDEAQQTEIKNRVAHILVVLKDCQDVFNNSTDGMYGFIGGQPCNDAWKTCYKGTIGNFGSSAVPLYCQHKILAGLRDIYLYMDGNEADASKEIFRKLSDWHVNLVSKMTDNTLQNWLGTEHGGVNETLIDAYRIFGEKKYLDAAKRYSHNYEINGMQTVNKTFLDNQHANTQVPKFIGFARIAQEDASATTFMTAARNFWTDVAQNRTVNIGGNSVGEHFLSVSGSNRYIDDLDGPESCNTNNMLKLSETLFDSTHEGKYADFYEAGMYNHILSTQDPTTGGYVYFTPLRPQSYRIYSKPNQDMWCCVGTGMENHSKYAHFIYTHNNNTLYVNLFTASKLENDSYALTQETRFPYEQSSTITVDKAGTYAIAIRKPSWVAEGYAVKVNGADVNAVAQNGYVSINRSWSAGDKITVLLPMALRYEVCPNMTDYIAFKYGPILLAARTTSVSEGDETGLPYEALAHEYALGERMGHAPGSYTQKKSLSTMPMLIGDRSEVLSRITPLDAESLTFTLDVSRDDELKGSYSWTTMTLQPYYTLHHSRLSNYFYQATLENYKNSAWAQEELKNLALEERTLTGINMGEQQQEAGAVTYDESSTKGNYRDESYRDAKAGGWIQVVLDNNDPEAKNLSLMLRYTTADKGRMCDIIINGTKMTTYTVPPTAAGANANGFYNVEIPLGELALGADNKPLSQITVRLEANHGTLMPGLYYIRLLKDAPEKYVFNAEDYRIADNNRATDISVDKSSNSFVISGKSGNNNICFGLKTELAEKYYVNSDQHYFVVRGTGLNINGAGVSYVWWFNGFNNASSVPPTHALEYEGEQVLVWDINKNAGMNGNFDQSLPSIVISNYDNAFIDAIGLTSSQADHKATITFVGYLTKEEVSAIIGEEDFGEDVTATYLKNPSFEADNAQFNGRAPKDWNFASDKGTSLGWIGVNYKGSDDLATDGNYIFGIWDGSNINARLYQNVVLPQGKYTLTADMMVTYSARLSKQCIYAGTHKGYYNYETTEEGCYNNNKVVQEIEAAPYQTIKIDFDVMADETIVELGAATSPISGRNNTWFKIDNFRLYKKNTPVGIDALSSDEAPAQIYNLSGQPVSSPAQGVYIISGKKVLVK